MEKSSMIQVLINQWKMDYKTLEECLNHEKKALEKNDYRDLKKIVSKKDHIVASINADFIQQESLFNQKNRSMIQFSLINQIQKESVNNTNIASAWIELMALVQSCYLKNEVNAQVVHLTHLSIKRRLNLIKGFDPDNNIYNKKGDRNLVQHRIKSLVV
jgi:flagellar biosynthesis/type III secretory pathway chaperone